MSEYLFYKKMSYTIFLFLSVSFFSHGEVTSREWDFDHRMYYSVIPLANKAFIIEVDTNNIPKINQGIKKTKKDKYKGKKTSFNFERGSALLIRKSLDLCKSYHYKLEILGGVIGVNDYKERPHLMHGKLKAKVICQ